MHFPCEEECVSGGTRWRGRPDASAHLLDISKRPYIDQRMRPGAPSIAGARGLLLERCSRARPPACARRVHSYLQKQPLASLRHQADLDARSLADLERTVLCCARSPGFQLLEEVQSYRLAGRYRQNIKLNFIKNSTWHQPGNARRQSAPCCALDSFHGSNLVDTHAHHPNLEASVNADRAQQAGERAASYYHF